MDATQTIAAIETRYAGHLFRSRLEARWAAFFDLTGIKWQYEPFDAAGYIPDFLIHAGSDQPAMLVEVKPFLVGSPEMKAEASRCVLRTRDVMRIPLLVVGCSLDFPKVRLGDHVAEEPSRVGCIALPWRRGEDYPREYQGGCGDTLHECWGCGAIRLVERDQVHNYSGCGHVRGGGGGTVCRGSGIRPEAAWAKAHELTRWTGGVRR